MLEYYLGLWKNLSYLEPLERAAIVLAFKPICLFIILWLLLLLRRVLVKLLFVMINKIHELLPSRKSFEARAASSNRISTRYETIYGKVSAIQMKRWGFVILLIAAAYYGFRLGVITYAPKIAQTGDQTYLGRFVSSEAEKYQLFEAEMLQKASEYQPLIPVTSQAVDQPQPEEAADSPEPKQEQEKWITLSEKGKKGVDVKKKPSKKAKKAAYVSGKDKVLFLSKNEKGWVKVQLKNGKKGWIKQEFLKGVPD